jgi:hypothetical protein
MGAGLSNEVEACSPVVAYQTLMAAIQRKGLAVPSAELQELIDAADSFFTIYSRLVAGGRFAKGDLLQGFGKDGVTSVNKSLNALLRFFVPCPWVPSAAAKVTFIADVTFTFAILANALRGFTQVFIQLQRATKPAIYCQFSIEIRCFGKSFSIEERDSDPPYRLRLLPIYRLKIALQQAQKKFVFLVAGHNAGKSHTVPLFLAIQGYGESRVRPFIFLVEHDQVLIGGLERFLTEVGSEDVVVVTTVAHAFTAVSGKALPRMVTIIILTPFACLELLKKLDNEKLGRMFTASRFIMDDMHRHSLETDLIMERLTTGVHATGTDVPAHFVYMSATPDPNLATYLSSAQLIQDTTPAPFTITKEFVLRDTIFEVTRVEAVKQTQRVLKSWEAMKEDFAAAPGAIAVFLSSDAICRKFVQKIRSLFDHTPLEGKRGIFPLFTDVRHNDDPKQFYGRLSQELALLKAEREGDIKRFRESPIFFVPIFLTKHAKASALQIIVERIPATIANFIVRIVVTTGDLPTLAIPDLTVVIDTGIHEVQYYDLSRGIDYVQEEPFPAIHFEEWAKLVGQTDNGLAILIGVKDIVRPKSQKPEVKRLDLSRSCLRLWRLNYRFTDLQNLPNEPLPELMSDCQAQFWRYGIMDDKGAKTHFGDQVLKFSFFRPLFAASVAKFLEASADDKNAALFACFIFYAIENSKELIAVPTADCFVNCFSAESDLVTLYLALQAVLSSTTGKDDEVEVISKAGFNASFVLELQQVLIDVTQGLITGTAPAPNQIVTEMHAWVGRQPGQTLGLIDRLFAIVHAFNPAWFALRTGKFVQIIGASSHPAVVYEANSFSNRRLIIERRPGWKGLIAPGGCYILSIRVNQTMKRDSGSLIHRIPGDSSPGVVSQQVEPVLNSPFFIALVEAYLGNQAAEKLIGIQLSRRARKTNTFLIHFTKTENATYMNYCPRTPDAGNLMANAIRVLRALLPYVPRAILVKRDIPALVVEIYSVGSSSYDTHLHLFQDPTANIPVAYNLNAAVLDHVAQQGTKLADAVPAYRFAITGECISYRTFQNKQVDLPLERPNASPTLDSVFGPFVSHLVLLVDPGQPAIPGQPKLPWIPPGGIQKITGFVDQSDLIDVANEIVSVQGKATRQADFWIVTLNNNQLTVRQGEIPKDIWLECSSTTGKDIGCNFYELVRVMARKSISGARGLSQVIPVKQLGSTSNNQTNIVHRRFRSAVRKAFASKLKCKRENVQFSWIDKEAFAVRVEKANADETRHRFPQSIDDRSYQPCALDAVLESCIPAGTPVSTVIHCPCVSFSINHFARSGLSQNDFERIVANLRDQYGFFVTCFDCYRNEPDTTTGKLGEMSLEVCDFLVGVSLAQAITAQIPVDSGYDSEALLISTRTMATKDLSSRRPSNYHGNEPNLTLFDSVRGIPADQIASIRSLVTNRAQSTGGASKWWVDENFRILVVPLNEDDELRQLLITLKREEGSALCFYECDGENPDDVIPQPTYVFHKDNTTAVVAMCRPCVQLFLTREVGAFFNPNNRLIIQNRLAELRERLKPLPAEPSIQDPVTDQAWPLIPLGALIWAYMSDRMGIAGYTKAWVTGVAEVAVRCAAHIFASCPNHQQFLLPVPEPGQSLKCEHCNLFFCGACRTWHEMDEGCDMGEIPGAKRCPKCLTPVFKTSGCNHITCRCGCHWCYKCRQGFEQKAHCYRHMTNEHGSYYVDPWA